MFLIIFLGNTDSHPNPYLFFAEQMAKVVSTCSTVLSTVKEIRDNTLSFACQVIQRLEAVEEAVKSGPISAANGPRTAVEEPFRSKDLPIKNKEELKAFERKMASSPKARDQLAS